MFVASIGKWQRNASASLIVGLDHKVVLGAVNCFAHDQLAWRQFTLGADDGGTIHLRRLKPRAAGVHMLACFGARLDWRVHQHFKSAIRLGHVGHVFKGYFLL